MAARTARTSIGELTAGVLVFFCAVVLLSTQGWRMSSDVGLSVVARTATVSNLGSKNRCGYTESRSSRVGNLLRRRGRLLIPGQDGIEDQGTFSPFMKPLSREETGKFGSVKNMVQNLRYRAAPWMERAEMIDILLRSGVSPEAITEDAGVTSMEQGNWRVALEVMNSLKSLGSEDEVLKYYAGDEENAEVAFGLRYIPKDLRVEAAKYAMEKNMDSIESESLSRNIVDYNRIKSRVGENALKGFEYTPADCVALRLYIQAAEDYDQNNVAGTISKARETGCSATAMKHLDELEALDFASRRQIIFKFKADTEEFDKALTLDAF